MPEAPYKTKIAEARAAMEYAAAHCPAYPTALLKSLGAYMDNKGWNKSPYPRFRPWRWSVAGCMEGYIPNNVSVRLDDEDGLSLPFLKTADLSDIQYSGMWLGRTQSKEYALYCIVPSLQHGRARPGATIENVKSFKLWEYTQEQLDEKVKQGWEIMQSMIAEDGPYQPENSTQPMEGNNA